MIQVQCIDKIKNDKGVIQYYTLLDNWGNKKTVTSDALKRAINNKQIRCINITLTSDNRLITKRTKAKPKVKRTMSPVEMYKEYLNSPYMIKRKVLGLPSEAVYRIDGEDVVLQKVNITNGTFIIQPFVTKLERIGYYCEVFSDCVELKVINNSDIDSTFSMFASCKKLVKLDLSEFDTSQITDMRNMFNGCIQLKELDLSTFDTSKVTDMERMFSGCVQLKNIDLSSFDTSNVTDMKSMFRACSQLEELELYSFDTSKVTDMNNMFEYCRSLKRINLSTFNTSEVIKMTEMFKDCSSLRKLDIHNFNTSKVVKMEGMFRGCYSLENLDIHNFSTLRLKYADYMFYNCNYKNTFKVPKGLVKELNKNRVI